MKALSVQELENISGEGFVSGFCNGLAAAGAIGGIGAALGWWVIAATGPVAVGVAVVGVACAGYSIATS